MFCRSDRCPIWRRHGIRAEYQAGIEVCRECGEPLVAPDPEAPAYESETTRRLERSGFVDAGLLRRRRLLPAGTAGWIIDVYAWFLRDVMEPRAPRHRLIEPTDEFFPIASGTDARTVQRIFDAVRGWAGMADWPCYLEAREDAAARHGSGLVGSFEPAEDGARITYDPALAAHPQDLIAMLAHELAHYAMSTARSPLPGGASLDEPATDLVAVFLGFGVFNANAAFAFKPSSDGLRVRGDWTWRTLGYLREAELSFALALFLRVQGIDPDRAVRHLDVNPRSYLATALRDLKAAEDDVERLQELTSASNG